MVAVLGGTLGRLQIGPIICWFPIDTLTGRAWVHTAER
eukprot:COSAG02_NODE_44583_length_365_cov_0.496241_1_plen_37_part_01